MCTAFFLGDGVLLALREQSPDAILLDVGMPNMSGMEAIRPIKKLAPETAVLMLSLFFDAEKKERSLANGAADFLLKLFSLDKIIAAVRSANSPRASESRPS